MAKKTLGQRVRVLRTKLGLSQPMFGDRVGCSGQMIGMIERDERYPGRRIAVQLELLSEKSGDRISIEEWP